MTHTNYYFRVTCYNNGNISWVCDDAKSYPTRERAIQSARYEADYWKMINHGAIEYTEKGAKVYVDTPATGRRITYYEVID